VEPYAKIPSKGGDGGGGVGGLTNDLPEPEEAERELVIS
jgi:hypothetical protein